MNYGSILRTLLLVLLTAMARNAGAALPAEVDGQPMPTLAPVLERVTPAVVNIHTQSRVQVRSPFANDPFFRRFLGVPRERVERNLGSGVIVDAARGLILTNNHVVGDADDIQVTLHDERTLEATLIGTDEDTDLAVIQVAAEDLTALRLADSSSLRVGDFVVAVGNPFGLGQTVTSGIVSALGRRGLRGLNYQNFIQTDASINPGNSGGALINLRGELIGINTAIFSPSGGNVGIGFAIPSQIAQYVMSELTEHGFVRRGRLGVSLQDIDDSLAAALDLQVAEGALVTRVIPDSAAEQYGIEEGDVIVRLGEERVRDADGLRNTEGLLPVEVDMDVVIVRDGKQQTVRLALAAIPPDRREGAYLDPRLAGAILEKLDQSITDRTGITGIRIAEVEPGSAAWQNGLRQNDVIRGVNRRAVSDLGSMEDALGSGQNVLQVLRGRRQYLTVLE